MRRERRPPHGSGQAGAGWPGHGTGAYHSFWVEAARSRRRDAGSLPYPALPLFLCPKSPFWSGMDSVEDFIKEKKVVFIFAARWCDTEPTTNRPWLLGPSTLSHVVPQL